MADKEVQEIPPFNPFTQIFISTEKMNSQSSNSTQSTVTKIPQGAKVIGNYLLGKNIGEGSFGKVYLAMHLPTSEKVAIKVIDKQKIKKKQQDVKKVKSQIQILKNVRHRHIVNLYEIIQTQKSLLLVTEYFPNGELFSLIIKQKKISEIDACLYFQQIISAVEYLHRNKIAHRDLKPENILLDYDNQLKLIDFGLSSFYDKNELKTFCGSPCYAAPEMVAAKKHYNPLNADLWSCGVILYSMLCGHLPFCDKDTHTLYKKILGGIYKMPSHLSSEAKSLIEGLLAVAPNKRVGLKQIKKHKWFNLRQPKEAYGLDIGQYLSADKGVLARLSFLGVKEQNVRNGLFKNQKDKDTASYYILMKKMVKSGDLVPSFIGNDNFNEKLIVKTDKKGSEDETEAVIIIEQAPQAPQAPLPNQQGEVNVGCAVDDWWYKDHRSDDQVREVDRSQLMNFARTILDVVISKYLDRPQMDQIDQILIHKEDNQKNTKSISQVQEDTFYAFNKKYREKVRDLNMVHNDSMPLKKQSSLRLSLQPSSLTKKRSLSNKGSQGEVSVKKIGSLFRSEMLIDRISNDQSKLKNLAKKINMNAIGMPNITKKLSQKNEIKIGELRKRYSVLKNFVLPKLTKKL